MKLLSLFSGIGAFEKALNNIRVEYELVGFSEIDKYAIKSYCAIHNVSEGMNLGDITKINTDTLPKDIDLITYGFPCQDISLAGKQKGMFNEDGTQTRSGLFFEVLRIIKATQPKFAIAENVKNLTSKKFKEQFEIVLNSLEEAGYNNYWQVLNAKDYGIPQNRERVFIVSIRKDIDKGFEFPKKQELTKRLKDLLEDKVDEKFYLSDKAIAGFTRHAERHANRGNGFGWHPTDGNVIANTLLASSNNRPSDNFIRESKCIQVGNLTTAGKYESTKRVYSSNGIFPTINTFQGGNTETKILCEQRSDEGLRFFKNDLCGTLRTIDSCGDKRIISDDRIRKITPKECWRLMGFTDEDFEKAAAVNSNRQLYKQAGNSIVVNVLEEIFKNLRF